MSSAKIRLMKDLRTITNSQDKTIYASPFEDNILNWCAIIIGPKETLFEDGTFSLFMEFKETYPNTPPEIRFVTKMFHPNVYENGEICLDILKNRWSPTYDVYGILMSVQSLLSDPNVKSPANVEAAELYEKDIKKYKIKVRECVENSWLELKVEHI